MMKMKSKQYQQKKSKKNDEPIHSWSVFPEDNVEIRKKLEAQKRDPDKVYPFMEKSDIEKQIVDQKHPYWNAVYARLVPTYHEKGCNHNHDLVERILISLPDVDVDKTVEFYRENGGHCDCEVINNVYNDADELQASGY